MLGMPLKIYKGNRIVMAVIVVIIISIIWMIVSENQIGDTNYWIWIIVVIAPLLLIIYWFTSVEITIYDNGISSKTFLGQKKMLWEEVTRFIYSAVKQSVNFIPVGTYYNLQMEDIRGQKIKIGNRANKMSELSNDMIQQTVLPLTKKAVDQYNSGATVDFGLIKLSRAKGFISKRLLRSIELPLDQIIDYRIEKGNFLVFRQGKRTAAICVSIGKVTNVFALIVLLDSIFKPRA